MKYRYKIIKIQLRLYKRLTLLAVAGWLAKLSFWICPDFLKEYNRTIIRKHEALVYRWDDE